MKLKKEGNDLEKSKQASNLSDCGEQLVWVPLIDVKLLYTPEGVSKV
jgi:hypothetical protein